MTLHHVLSAHQFLDTALVEELFSLASALEENDKNRALAPSLKGRVLATVFYEPSTRTRFSFETAMLKLGGQVVTTESASHFSSAIKGESLEDSIRIISGYADAIVLRHFERGASQRAAQVSSVPVINAGDGDGEHPTQALLDLYTIKKETGRLNNLRIALVGDLLYGRTIHSLVTLLTCFDRITIHLISPPQLRLPEPYKDVLRSKGIPFEESAALDALDHSVDVVYATRVQKERFAKEEDYLRLKDAYRIDRGVMEKLYQRAIVMHPLPRVTEIAPEVDRDPRAAYFRQARNGLYIRMALLQMVLGGD